MELIRISEDKIKISLSKAELDAYDLSMEGINQKNIQTRTAFREIFVEAREQTGFDADKEKVFVQIFRAKNGGCEIFVSKINYSAMTLQKKLENPIRVFEFDELEQIISACRAIDRLGYSDPSSVYRSEGLYYLMLDTESDAALDYAKEHGGYEKKLSPFYIGEHFLPIRESDAVNVISNL